MLILNRLIPTHHIEMSTSKISNFKTYWSSKSQILSNQPQCTCMQVIAFMHILNNENSDMGCNNWNFRLERILKPVFMLLKFRYFVNNTVKCVYTFFCCKGTLGQTTWPFWPHSANWLEFEHGWTRWIIITYKVILSFVILSWEELQDFLRKLLCFDQNLKPYWRILYRNFAQCSWSVQHCPGFLHDLDIAQKWVFISKCKGIVYHLK